MVTLIIKFRCCSGKENIVADILSRYQEDMTSTPKVIDPNVCQMNETKSTIKQWVWKELKNVAKYRVKCKRWTDKQETRTSRKVRNTELKHIITFGPGDLVLIS